MVAEKLQHSQITKPHIGLPTQSKELQVLEYAVILSPIDLMIYCHITKSDARGQCRNNGTMQVYCYGATCETD